MDYILVAFAVLLLAFEFALSKKYQALEGTSMAAGLRFNTLSGVLSAVIMWAISGFQVEWSAFSLVMAFTLSLCCLSYSLLSFQVLKEGDMTLYSTFLMSGGMLLPYAFGVLFLEESLTLWRILGVILVLAAIVLGNFSRRKVSNKILLLCCVVFVLNGCVSILSKCHQISQNAPVSSSMFVAYSGLTRAFMTLPLLLMLKNVPNRAKMQHRLSPWVVAAAAVISGGSYLLQLVGAKTLPATVLYPMVTGGCIIFSSLAGRVFFREKLSLQQKISIAVCFVGTLLFL